MRRYKFAYCDCVGISDAVAVSPACSTAANFCMHVRRLSGSDLVLPKCARVWPGFSRRHCAVLGTRQGQLWLAVLH